MGQPLMWKPLGQKKSDLKLEEKALITPYNSFIDFLNVSLQREPKSDYNAAIESKATDLEGGGGWF